MLLRFSSFSVSLFFSFPTGDICNFFLIKASDVLKMNVLKYPCESRHQQHSPPAQRVEAVKADGVREGQALQHRSLNSVDRLQTEEEGRGGVQRAFREECDRLRGAVTVRRRAPPRHLY